MGTYLRKIRFLDADGNCTNEYGYQETPTRYSSELVNLYDENGDQLDKSVNRKWELCPFDGLYLEDSDEFWDVIESMRLW